MNWVLKIQRFILNILVHDFWLIFCLFYTYLLNIHFIIFFKWPYDFYTWFFQFHEFWRLNRTRKRLFFCLFLDNFTRIFLSPEHIDWNKNFSFEKKNLHFIKFPFYLSSNELDLQHILCLNEHCTFKCIPYKSNDFIYSFPFSKINELKRKKKRRAQI